MATKGGTITKRDLIEDDALKFGEELKQQADIAINSFEELKKSARSMAEIVNGYRKVDTQNGFLEQKKQEQIENLKSMNAIKQLQAAEISLDKIKRASLATDKVAIDVESKRMKLGKENLTLLIEDEKLNQQKAKSQKEQIALDQQLARLGAEKQKALNEGLKVNGLVVKNLQEEERLTQQKLSTIKSENTLIEQRQRIIKNDLDIKAKELAAIKKEEDAKRRLEKPTADEIVNNGVLARNARTQAILNSKLTTEYEKLIAKKKIAADALQTIIIRQRQAGESAMDYNIKLQRAQMEFDHLHDKVVQADRAIKRFNDNVGNYPQLAGEQIKDLVGAFGVVVGIDLFATSVEEAFNVVRNFEGEIVNLAAIAGYTRDEIQPLEHDIREVAKASINSATEVAQLATELIKLGSTPEEVSKLLAPVNNLSVALKATAEDSASLVKGLLNAYGESAEQAVRYTDVLAESANRSALDFQGLRDSFSYLAPTARTLNIPLEETAAILGTLVDNNIKAESAGRLTSTGFSKLAASGIRYKDALETINKAQRDGKDELEVLNVANRLFGVEAGKIGIILANNVKKTEESTKAYKNSGGALEELTKKQLKSINAELEMLSSAWEEEILNANEAADGTRIITGTLQFLTENLRTIINVVTIAGAGWLTYRGALILANIQARLMAIATAANTFAQAENNAVTTFSTASVTANATSRETNAAATGTATTAQITNTTATRSNSGIIGFQTTAQIANTSARRANTTAVGFQTAAQQAATVVQQENVVVTNFATLAWQRFNLALKANLLGIAVAAIITAIYYLNKLSVSLAENTEETKKNTDAFVRNREIIGKNEISIKRLSDRYDELKSKTKLTTDEQIELEKIIKILAKTVPNAVSAVDKYGDAIAINTLKTKAFTDAQKEIYKLETGKKIKENTELLKKLRSEQETLTISEKDLNAKYIEGIGYIRRRNGNLEVYNKLMNSGRALTVDEQIEFKKKVLLNEQNVGIVEKNIRVLKGLTEAEKSQAKAADDSSKMKQEASIRTIEVIDAEIKALEDSVATLSDKTGKEGDAVKAKIKALQAERELIYSSDKVDKKSTKDRLKSIKDIRDAIYNLSQFRLQNEIDINQRIIDNEKSTTVQRIQAFYELVQLRDAKNDETLQHDLERNALEKDGLKELTKEKLNQYVKDAENRIKNILAGRIATEKLTNEEKLILEKFYADKKKLQDDDALTKQTLVDDDVAKIQKKIDDEIAEQDRRLNAAIEAENKIFLATHNVETDNLKTREQDIFEHERRIFEIRKKFAIDNLKIQATALQAELDADAKKPEAEQLSAEKINKIRQDLQAATTAMSEIELLTYSENSDKKKEIEQQFSDFVKESAQSLHSALTDLGNALFERKISNIDAEIQKNNEYYANQIAAAGNDARKKDALEKEQAKKNEQLEAKKRKEQIKQAKFNKAMMLTQAIISAGLAVLNGLNTTPFLPMGLAMAVAAGAIGAIQIATIAATPLPQYKHGRPGGPAETAVVGDGFINEIISAPDGSNPRMTPARPTLVNLLENEIVHSSPDAYNKFMRASILSNVEIQNKRMNDYQSAAAFDQSLDKEILEEMKRNTRAVENNKSKTTIINKVDFGDQLWRYKNINWNA